jgi:hypothetical protein
MNSEDKERLQSIVEAADEQRQQLLDAITDLSSPSQALVSKPGEKPVTRVGRAISNIKATVADAQWIKEQAEKVLRSQQFSVATRPGVEL